MMKNIKIVILLLLFYSCGNSNSVSRKGSEMKLVDLDQISTPSVYDVFSKIEIIPLESSSESLLKQVTGIVKYNKFFYILDRELNYILVYDSIGQCVNKINKMGNGPGEYAKIVDIQFNRFTGELELLSPMKGILKYDSMGKNYKGCVDMPRTVLAIHNFYPISPDKYVFFSDSREGNKMIFYDAKYEKITSEAYNLPRFLFSNTLFHHTYTPFYLYNDTVRFVQSYNGDVFSLNHGLLAPTYQWDFGKYNFDISDLKEESIPYYMKYARTVMSKNASLFICYGENSHYYLSQFVFKRRTCHLLLNKKDNSYIVFNAFKEGVTCLPRIMDDIAVYAVVSPDDISLAVNPKVLDEENKRKYEAITLDDNPVIIKYTFK